MTVKFTVAVVVATGDSLDRESDHGDYHTGVASPLVASLLSLADRCVVEVHPMRSLGDTSPFLKTRSAEAKM